MDLIFKLLSGLTRIASFVGAACILLMMLNVSADVFMRQVFNAPLPGTITIVSNYYMVLIVFLGLAAAEREDSHVSVEFLTDLLKERYQQVLAALARLITAAIFGLLAYRGTQAAIEKTAIKATILQGTDLIVVWPTYWAIPVGAGLMAALATWRFAGSLIRRSQPEPTEGAAP